MSGFIYLNSQNFENFINVRQNILEQYDALNTEYDNIVNTLLQSWKGHGADAFRDDAQKVKSNIVGIEDVLKTMFDTLIDCHTAYKDCDLALGKANREAGK